MIGPPALVVAAVGTALAAALAVPGGRGFAWHPRADGTGLVAAITGGATLVGIEAVGTDHLVPLAIAAAGAGMAARLWRRRRRRRDQLAVADRVLECCETLSSELGAGQPTGAALAHAADGWSGLEPVVAAFDVGADVPESLRRLARHQGAEDLRLLAAAWQVSHRTGQGLARAVDRVAGDLVAARATRRVVAGELASARATARLVAALPLFALTMGQGTGGDPWHFLLATPAGWACLGSGLALELGGLWWLEALAQDVDRGG